jgi:hypothetical protein
MTDKPPADPLPARYRQWIAHVFDRPEIEGGWYFASDDIDFAAGDAETVALVAATMQRSGEDLARFSERQVKDGLAFIFNNACSDTVYALMADGVPPEARLAAIASIRTLYADCFERRCAPVLAHLDEPGGNSLNQSCYMLWDVTSLGYWEGHADKDVFYAAVLALLEDVLASHHDACLESALHGLGHLHAHVPEGRVAGIIDSFLARRWDLRPELARYARQAAMGYIL